MQPDITSIAKQLKCAFDAKGLSCIADSTSEVEKRSILERAQGIAAGEFWFCKPWDMERCEKRFSLGEDHSHYDWNIILNDDEEWCFMLNRMDYLEDLALASLISGDVSYAHLAKELIISWIEAHPTIQYERSTRTLDTGIRIRTWAIVLPCLVGLDALTAQEVERIVASMQDQMSYLKESFIPKYITGNWGSIQMSSIIEVYHILGLEQDELYFWVLQTLEQQVDVQVYADGANWELSPMYHVEVELYLAGVYAALESASPLKKRLADTLSAMAYALASEMMPSGSIDAQGDSDVLDIRPILALSAGLLHDGKLKFLAADASISAFELLHFGADLADEYRHLAAQAYDIRTFDGLDSGIFSARSSWNRDANMTLFLNGPLGSSHGHADNLHVTCAYAGTPILVDSGRFTYREDSAMRPYLKSPMAHNAIMVDGKSTSAPKGSWSYDSFVKPLKTYAAHDADLHYWEGTIVDSAPLSVISRKLFFVEKGLWVCFDEVMCDGEHDMCQRFHLDPHLHVSLISHKGVDAYQVAPNLKFCATAPLDHDVEAMSQDYNKLFNHEVIRLKTSFKDVGHSSWSLCPAKTAAYKTPILRADGSEVDESLACAWKLELSENEAYTFVVFHQEVCQGLKAFMCDGAYFHAKSVVIHTKDGKTSVHAMRA